MKLATRVVSIIVLGLLGLLVACVHVAGSVKTIEFTYLAGSQTWEEAYAALTEAFEQANPDVKVERIRMQGDHSARLVALMASGTVPDVIALDIQDLMSFADERFLYDLNPFIQKTPEYQVQRIAAPIMNAYTVDGKLYAAPILTNPAFYGYNIELFDLAGLAYPADLYKRDAWTWSAFREAARKLTRKGPDGQRTVIGAALHLPRTWMASNGGAEFDDPKRPTKSVFDDEANVETLSFLNSLIWQDDAMLPVSALTREIGANETLGFAQGKIGMSARWLASIPAMAGGGFQMGLVPYPKGPGPKGQYASDLGMFGIAIAKQTKDIDSAWRFVSFITGPVGSAIDAKLLGRTPPRPLALTWLPQTVVNPEIYPELLIYGNLRVISRDRTTLQRMINQGLTPLWNNTIDAKSAATEIARQLNAFLQQNPQ
ncbi:MAG: ABC transporter substrate-binding protein [Limnochordia bacterium]|jgi:ABC-type glycerol-3-phosphate transport system substrate-binding protein